jgi:zinc protease
MTGLVLTDDVVDPERQVIIEERRARTDNEPQAQLGEMVNASLYLNHPYRIPVIGWKHEMEGLTTGDAIDFYRRWYRPNNAVLVLEGDITAAEVKPLVEKYYGPVPRGEDIVRARLHEPPQNAPRRVTLTSPRVRQPSLWIEYLAPSYHAGETGQAYALQVLNEILGGGAVSRLYRGLVVEQGIAAGAGAGYSASSYDLSSFRVYVSPRPGLELEPAEAALRAAVAELLENGVTETEVAEAKERLVAAAVYARDSFGSGANIFGRALTTGQTVEDVEAWPERISAVTADQVNAAARAVLQDNSSVTGVLLPDPTS